MSKPAVYKRLLWIFWSIACIVSDETHSTCLSTLQLSVQPIHSSIFLSFSDQITLGMMIEIVFTGGRYVKLMEPLKSFRRGSSFSRTHQSRASCPLRSRDPSDFTQAQMVFAWEYMNLEGADGAQGTCADNFHQLPTGAKRHFRTHVYSNDVNIFIFPAYRKLTYARLFVGSRTARNPATRFTLKCLRGPPRVASNMKKMRVFFPGEDARTFKAANSGRALLTTVLWVSHTRNCL